MNRFLNIVLIILFLQGCVETFEVETRGFEGLLVVDAKLTDELKRQKVNLSRARPFEVDSVIAERNATIRMTSGSGSSHAFQEVSPGLYESLEVFGASRGESYQMEIVTADGSTFLSEEVTTPNPSAIEDLHAGRTVKDDGDEGISIMLNSRGSVNGNSFLRYEYEEDYKIIAPDWSPWEFDIVDDDLCDIVVGQAFGFGVELKPNENNNRVCYGHRESTDIILADSENLIGNSVSDYRLRFISKNDFAITHRYSILVKQVSLNQNAYSYYENLDSFSSNDDVFTSIQPGFLEGNIRAADGISKVVGFFEVSSVRSQRLFFNYTDFFPNENGPPYPINCTISSPALIPPGAHCSTAGGISDGTLGSPLIDGIRAGLYVYYMENLITPERIAENEGRLGGLGPFWVKPKACGDCTELGSNIKPEFWIE
ncbi:DUF4249 domain-containing protein [Maribacter algarum]|nr:DUF4249 domain-containing protein [Maribacter algarum]